MEGSLTLCMGTRVEVSDICVLAANPASVCAVFFEKHDRVNSSREQVVIKPHEVCSMTV